MEKPWHVHVTSMDKLKFTNMKHYASSSELWVKGFPHYSSKPLLSPSLPSFCLDQKLNPKDGKTRIVGQYNGRTKYDKPRQTKIRTASDLVAIYSTDTLVPNSTS